VGIELDRRTNNPVKALYCTAVINGFLPLLFLDAILIVASDK
jgi:hypothetical protein